MSPLRLLNSAILPALADLATGGIRDTPMARQMLLCIALQESEAIRRRQRTASGYDDGPAMGFWQFEKGGGCVGVLTHQAVAKHMRWVCNAYTIEPNSAALWKAIQFQDVVAASAARLLLYTLPQALPTTEAEGWEQYLQAWRPGAPHPEKWAGHWATAARVVREIES